jgi:hypothetical protein
MDSKVSAPDQTPPAWRRVSSETVILDRKAARDFAARHHGLPNSPSEREIDPGRKKELQERIAAGAAVPFSWATVLYERTTYRMNGQHSSAALLEFPGNLPEELVFHVDAYEALAKEGMARLFQQFDARWSSRSRLDVSGAYQGLERDIAKCDRKTMKLAIEGVAFYRRSIERIPLLSREGKPIGGDELFDLFFETALHPFLKWFDTLISRKTPEMKLEGVAGAMFVTFQKSESGAREFWRNVAKNNITDENDPAGMLEKELSENIGNPDRSKRLKSGPLYGKSIKAWNAFRAGDKVKSLVYRPEKGFPEVAD